MEELILIVLICISIVSMMCLILGKTLATLTVIAAVCWIFNLFSVTSSMVLWLFFGAICSVICLIILAIIASAISMLED